MVAFMDANGTVGICGPIHFPTAGSIVRLSLRHCSEIRRQKPGRLLRRVPGPEATLRIEEGPFEADWVDGACFMIRRDVIEQVGDLDEAYFLYAEELDWCFRVRKAGWTIFALPDVTMIHYQGQSSAQMSDFSLAHLVETRLRYYQKNHGLSVATLTSLVYLAGSARQWNRNPRKEKVKMRATLRWWRSLLTA
jgi:GT2 family glycosyltransferase